MSSQNLCSSSPAALKIWLAIIPFANSKRVHDKNKQLKDAEHYLIPLHYKVNGSAENRELALYEAHRITKSNFFVPNKSYFGATTVSLVLFGNVQINQSLI